MKAHLAKAPLNYKDMNRLLRIENERLGSILANRDTAITDLRKKRLSAVCRAKAFQKHYKDAKAQAEALRTCKAVISDALIAEQDETKKWHDAYKETRKQFVDETAANVRLAREVDAEHKQKNLWLKHYRDEQDKHSQTRGEIQSEIIRGDSWCYAFIATAAIATGLFASIVWG